ncbi:MAG: hypothetical protein EOM73_15795 [Bacteroidia bacterium]|nr:hypothetical protein [Bacteroidia bacterium]
MYIDELKAAFYRLIEHEEHNIRSISRLTGVNNSTLNRLNSKKADFENIPAKTVQRLFPEMKVYFFRTDWPDGAVLVHGANNAPIANGSNARASVRYGRNAQVLTGSANSPLETVQDESTRMLLTYWKDLPQSKRFEFLMKLAQIKEDTEHEKK